MSIALTNRVKQLEQQVAAQARLIAELEARVKALEPKPIGRPRKESTGG